MPQSKLVTNINSPEDRFMTVYNDDSVDLPINSPVCFSFDGSGDGIGVVLPSTGGTAKATSLLAGIVVGNAIPSTGLPRLGQVQTFGFCRQTKVLRQTRAATTDAWASYPAVALGDLMVVETVNNAVSRNAAGAQSAYLAGIMAAETLASATTVASNATDTRTAITTTMKTFLRIC